MTGSRKGWRLVVCVGGAVSLVLGVAVSLNWRRIRMWYLLLEHFETLESVDTRHPEYRHKATGLVMVLVPATTFTMGSRDGEPGAFPHEQPRHRVELDAFLIAKYEVSQAEWRRVMGDAHIFYFQGEHLPAQGISWIECKRFCEASGLSLPTEAQWECACRAGTTTPFSCGVTLTGDEANHDRLYYTSSALSRPAALPVYSFEPNDFGLYNMHGNVEEWCEDSYAADFYSRLEAGGRNPVCRDPVDSRVARGGSFLSTPEECRSASRNPLPFSTAGSSVGLRPVFCFD